MKALSLGEKARLFPRLFCLKLVPFIYALPGNYEITFGEAWRPATTAEVYAGEGKGIRNSLHVLRLAFDINLYRKGVYLRSTEDYKDLGVFWESLSTTDYKCCWGGRFHDGNHFSIEHNGVK